jgi:hypothetical protein
MSSVNDFPNEILLEILSYFGPEDLLFVIPEVCDRWKALAKKVILWKKISYKFDRSSDLDRVVEVRCTTLLELDTNFAPCSVLKVRNLKY